MKAFVLHRHGGPSAASLDEWPAPTPAPGELLVRVAAAGLNPVDFKTRQGKLRAILGFRLPRVFGNEFSGVVEAVGSDVSNFSVGDRVFARLDKANPNAFAELATVDAKLAALAPAVLPLAHAACVPLAALTAQQCLDALDLPAGSSLLISGGAGGVGSFALQLAKSRGLRVTTTASSAGEALVRRLGADEVIDYRQRRANDEGARFAGAIDLVGGDALQQCLAAVEPGGRVVSVAGTPEPRTADDIGGSVFIRLLFWCLSIPLRLKARRHGVDYRFLLMHPDAAGLRQLASAVDSGSLEVVVDQLFPFDRIQDAFAYLEAGHAKGKVAVVMDEQWAEEASPKAQELQES